MSSNYLGNSYLPEYYVVNILAQNGMDQSQGI